MRSILIHLAIVAAVLLVHAPDATAQTAEHPWEGEVTGTNVYVRSGAGANWYPTTKLNTGNRVVVLGERYGWYRIVPPAGSDSFVDKAMVDRTAGASRGTIRQDKVYVRAGSALSKHKNATQVVLNRGDTVEIHGEVEGFLKIAPPPGAGLYMSKQYVRPVSDGMTTGIVQKHLAAQSHGSPANSQSNSARVAEPISSSQQPTITQPQITPNPTPAGVEPQPVATIDQRARGDAGDRAAVQIPPAQPDTDTGGAGQIFDPNLSEQPGETGIEARKEMTEVGDDPAPIETDEPTRQAPTTETFIDEPAPAIEPATPRWQSMLNLLEGELVAMLNRPIEQQDPVSLRDRYEEIAQQTDEMIPAEIAKIRVRQLTSRIELQSARRELNEEESELEAYRANMNAERMRIMRRRVEAAMAHFDLEGELRRSFAFAPENRRYRLVNPQTNNTIAYVDVPRSVLPDAEHLVGRLVGIRAAGQSFSPSARVPIAVAGSVVDLSSRQNQQPPAIPDIHAPETPGPLGAAISDEARPVADATADPSEDDSGGLEPQ